MTRIVSDWCGATVDGSKCRRPASNLDERRSAARAVGKGQPVVIEFVLIGKVLAPFASKAAAAVVQRTLADRKTARSVAREVTSATADDFDVESRRVKRALRLPEMAAAFSSTDQTQGMSAAVRLFAAELTKQRRWRDLAPDEIERRSVVVVQEAAKVLLRYLPVGEGLNVVDARAADRATATSEQLTRIELAVGGQRLLDLADLPQTISAELHALVDQTPEASALITVFTTAVDPADDIAGWLDHPPSWVSTPLAWICLGLTLEALGRPELGATAILRGIEEGQGDRRRWEAHAARLLMGNADDQALQILQGHTDGLGAALRAAIQEKPEEVIATLNLWDPPEELERDIKAVLAASALQILGKENEAIQVLRAREPNALGTTVKLKLAWLLILQAHDGRALNRDDQLRAAATLAVEMRDKRRRWRGDSAEAVMVAANAHGLLHDWGGVWRLVRPAPEGEATISEARHPAVLERATTAALGLGDPRLAARLIESGEAGGPYLKAFIHAIELEAKEDTSPEALLAIQKAWRAALELANDDMQGVWAANRLLVHGGTSEHIEKYRERAPAAMTDVDEVNAALTAKDKNVAITRLRGIRRSNRFAVMALADLYTQQGRQAEMLEVLAEAADNFDDQHLRMMAADHLASKGDIEQAAQYARAAVDQAGPGWNGQRRAEQIILEDLSMRGDWTAFITVARRYLGAEENPRVRWALALALAREGQPEAAWQVVTAAPEPLHPLEPFHAQLYLQLLARFSTPELVISQAVAALNRFGMDNEEFAAAVLAITMTASATDDADDETSELTAEDLPAEVGELRQLMQQFAERYPDSRRLVPVTVDPDDPAGIVEAVTERLRPGHAQRVRLEDDVALGKIPTGVLTSVLQMRYAEGFLRLAGGGLRVRSPILAQRGAERLDAQAFLQRPGARSLVDASALHTCALLSEHLRDQVMAVHQHLLLTKESLTDLKLARDSVALRGSASMGLDRSGNFYFTEASEEERLALRPRAQLMLDLAQIADFIPSSAVAAADGRDPARFQPWLNLAPTASEQEAFLWCDDTALRGLARAAGVATFGTMELVEALAERGELSEDQRDEIHLELLAERVFDLDLTGRMLAVQAQKDQWRPGAAAAALARPWTWQNSRLGFDLLDEAISRNAATPDVTEGWMFAAAYGCSRLQATPDMIAESARLVLVRSMLSAGLSPAMTPPLVRGVRAAAADLGANDPVPVIWAELNEQLLTHYDTPTAARLLIATASGLPEVDRQAAARAVLGIK